jgi:hypothetical protein
MKKDEIIKELLARNESLRKFLSTLLFDFMLLIFSVILILISVKNFGNKIIFYLTVCFIILLGIISIWFMHEIKSNKSKNEKIESLFK